MSSRCVHQPDTWRWPTGVSSFRFSTQPLLQCVEATLPRRSPSGSQPCRMRFTWRSACTANARLGQEGEGRGGAGSRGEDPLALLAQLALRPDVPVERHGGDPEFAAERGHGGIAVRHRRPGLSTARTSCRRCARAAVSPPGCVRGSASARTRPAPRRCRTRGGRGMAPHP